MSEKPEGSNGVKRWWENYVLRYALGSMLGGAIVFCLWRTSHAAIYLFGNPPKPTGDLSSIGVYGLLGLAYCYIASAPILVLHYTRYLRVSPFRKPLKFRIFLLSSGVIAISSGGSVAWFLQAHSGLGGALASAISLCSGLAVGIFLFTIAYWLEASQRESVVYGFYSRLSSKKLHPENAGLVESYRDLREHGNSLMIVFLELILAAPLAYINIISNSSIHLDAAGQAIAGSQSALVLRQGVGDSAAYYLAALCLWVLPAMSAWTFASRLERRFSRPTP